MGIEPTRETLSGLENERFGATADAKCDGRVNFRGTWGHVGIRAQTVLTSDVLGGMAGRRTVYTSIRQLSTMLRPFVFASPDPWPSTASRLATFCRRSCANRVALAKAVLIEEEERHAAGNRAAKARQADVGGAQGERRQRECAAR